MSFFEDYVEEGLCCECCGAAIDGGEPGFVRRCAGCREPVVNRGRKRETDGQSALPRFNPYSIPPRAGSVACPHCPRHVMPQGLQEHIRAKHPEKAKEQQS